MIDNQHTATWRRRHIERIHTAPHNAYASHTHQVQQVFKVFSSNLHASSTSLYGARIYTSIVCLRRPLFRCACTHPYVLMSTCVYVRIHVLNPLECFCSSLLCFVCICLRFVSCSGFLLYVFVAWKPVCCCSPHSFKPNVYYNQAKRFEFQVSWRWDLPVRASRFHVSQRNQQKEEDSISVIPSIVSNRIHCFRVVFCCSVLSSYSGFKCASIYLGCCESCIFGFLWCIERKNINKHSTIEPMHALYSSVKRILFQLSVWYPSLSNLCLFHILICAELNFFFGFVHIDVRAFGAFTTIYRTTETNTFATIHKWKQH